MHSIKRGFTKFLHRFSKPKTVSANNSPTYRAYNERGLMHCKREEYALAIADFTQAITLNPKFAPAYFARGLAHKKLGKNDLASKDYTQAITLAPRIAFAYNNRGLIYLETKDYTRAIEDFTQAITLDSNNANHYYNRGITYLQCKKYNQAIEDCTRVITLNPDDSYAYTNRGITNLLLGVSLQASADLKRACEIDPRNSIAVWTLLWVNFGKQCEIEKLATALENIATTGNITNIETQQYFVHLCQGTASGLRSNWQVALAELEICIQMQPDEWDAYFWKGMFCAYYYQGQQVIAQDAIEKALGLDLPPVLLKPLYWLETDRPEFFAQYAKPLLERYGV